MRSIGNEEHHAIGTHQNPGLVVHQRLVENVHESSDQKRIPTAAHAMRMTSR